MSREIGAILDELRSLHSLQADTKVQLHSIMRTKVELASHEDSLLLAYRPRTEDRQVARRVRAGNGRTGKGTHMIVAGIVLLVLALIIPALHFLFWVGVALLVIGLVLLAVGSTGNGVGRRRHYW